MDDQCNKRRHYLRVFCVACGLLFLSAMKLEGSDKPESPSDCRPGSCASVGFVLTERHDLRILFCTPKTLTARIEQRVCIVDMVGGPRREVVIQENETVAAVMKKIENDCHTTGQLRLVTKDAIRQSALMLGTACNDAEFMRLSVSPGDFIIIAAKQ
jgi:hypothetical protein